MNNVIQSTLPKFQSNLSLRNSLNPFSGALSAANSDVNFEEITTGDSHEISEITAVDGAVITFAGGPELHTDSNAASIGNEADATTGWTQSNLDAGANVWESQGGVKSDGSYALHSDVDDTPTGGARFFKNIATDFSLVVDTWYRITVDVRHIGTGGEWSFGLGATSVTAVGSWQFSDSVSTGDTSFATFTFNFQYDGTNNIFICRESNVSNDGGVYFDKFSVKLLHDYSAGDVISIGGVESEAVGAEIATGSVVDANYYIITATEVDHFYTGCAIDDVFLGSEGIISQALDANNKVKLIPPVLAKPYRIDSIDANGVCTLLNADFSDLAAPITSGYTTSATLTNYTEGDGWMPGLDLDPTPVNENSEFDQWDFGSELVTGTDSDMSGANNWVNQAASTTVVGGELEVVGNGGANDYTALVGVLTAGECYAYTVSLTEATDAGLSVMVGTSVGTLGTSDYHSFHTATSSKVAYSGTFVAVGTGFAIGVQGAGLNGLTLKIDDVSVTEITPDNFTVSGLSATNYLVYDTTLNTIRFVSDGSALYIEATGLDADTAYFHEVGVTDVVDAGLYLTYTSPNDIFNSVNHYQGFSVPSISTIRLSNYTTCDTTASYFRLYAATDTYAVCDGSQSAASDLESTGASITSGKGYKSTIVLDSISAGTVTPVISTQPGAAISSPATNVQNIKANGTDTAKIRANTAAEGVKITEWTIEQYS